MTEQEQLTARIMKVIDDLWRKADDESRAIIFIPVNDFDALKKMIAQWHKPVSVDLGFENVKYKGEVIAIAKRKKQEYTWEYLP